MHCDLDLKCNVSSSPILCYGTFPMKENTYLYHGSPTLFESPYELNKIDNRLSPSPHIPSFFATKLNGAGFIYEYKATDKTLKLGGIPDILFACGKFSDIQSKLENELNNLCKKHNCNPMINYPKLNYSPYDEIVAKICYTPFNGLFVPGYENQIVLCYNKKFLQINNIYFVIRYSSTESFNSKIDMKLSHDNFVVLQDKTIDLKSKLNKLPLRFDLNFTTIDTLDNTLIYVFDYLIRSNQICQQLRDKYYEYDIEDFKHSFKMLLSDLSQDKKKYLIDKFTNIIEKRTYKEKNDMLIMLKYYN